MCNTFFIFTYATALSAGFINLTGTFLPADQNMFPGMFVITMVINSYNFSAFAGFVRISCPLAHTKESNGVKSVLLGTH